MGDVPLWMPLCGQDWPRTAGGFLGMWIAMMAAMMAPSLAPVLRRLHAGRGARGAALTAVTACGYLAVWTAIGVGVFALGAPWAQLVLERPALARSLPWLTAAVLVLAGALQCSRWKAGALRCWR